MKNNYYLVLSSCLLIISIIYFICHFNTNNYQILLVLLLLSNLICSILFWRKGICKSVEHKIDAYLAKLSFIFFLSYTLFIKENCFKSHKIILIFITIIILLLFYLSNKYSKKKWCSRKHIISHSIFHLFIMSGSLIAFI